MRASHRLADPQDQLYEEDGEDRLRCDRFGTRIAIKNYKVMLGICAGYLQIGQDIALVASEGLM